MNPEAPAGPSISAGSLPASQMNPAPTPTIPCSPSLAHRTPKSIHNYCSSSSSSSHHHTAPTTIPCTISGPATGAAPLRSRAFHVTAPVPSLSTGTFWVGVAQWSGPLFVFVLQNKWNFCSFYVIRQLPRLFIRRRSSLKLRQQQRNRPTHTLTTPLSTSDSSPRSCPKTSSCDQTLPLRPVRGWQI